MTDAPHDFARFHDELHRVAARLMRHQPSDHTLQATALVNEAFVRMQKRLEAGFTDDHHFIRSAAVTMRSILVDAGRRRQLRKKGQLPDTLELEEAAASIEREVGSLIDLDDALERLEAQDPKLAEVATLRLFAGLDCRTIAEIVDRPLRTTEHHWTMAKQWLKTALR